MGSGSENTSWFETLDSKVRETVTIEGQIFQIDRPADPAAVFNHPAVMAAKKADNYLPHWINLWPAARMLAAAILREPWETHQLKNVETPFDVLEVGCGLGLAGIAALARGLRVTFSDLDETALKFAENNALLNGYSNFQTRLIDFRSPPEGLKYPVVVGSDVIYQDRLVRPLVGLLCSILAPGGLCLFADPDRPDGNRFRSCLREAGFAVETETRQVEEPGCKAIVGTIDRIRFAVRKQGW
jgi:SAM-dependent methyltransferase